MCKYNTSINFSREIDCNCIQFNGIANGRNKVNKKDPLIIFVPNNDIMDTSGTLKKGKFVI